MKSFLITGLLAGILMTSCKKDEAAPDKPKVPTFAFTVNAVVPKNDNFQLFYKEEADSQAFSETSSVWVEVKGNEKPQDITFELPEDVVPAQFRLDLGTNKEQAPITINNCKVTFKDRKIDIQKAEFFTYFVADTTFAKVDTATGKVAPFVTKTGAYDPQVFSGTILADKIQTMLK